MAVDPEESKMIPLTWFRNKIVENVEQVELTQRPQEIVDILAWKMICCVYINFSIYFFFENI